MKKSTVTINNKELDIEYRDGQRYVNGIEFDGHYAHWSFVYEPETYLKESELSGDQWRKGGYIRIYRNGVCVREEFCREPLAAASRMWHLLAACMDLHVWDDLEPGFKCYYQDVPAVVVSVSNGEVVVKTEDGSDFPVWAFEKEAMNSGEMVESDRDWTDHMKDHATSPKFHWFRREQP